jgi:hypothetical protein
MTPNNNYSVLPFYTDINKQAHRKSYAYGEIYPLITPINNILPFQIIRTHKSGTITSALIKRLDGSTLVNVTTTIIDKGLTVHAGTSYDVITYHGRLPLAIDVFEGQYYLQITDGTNTWYSEVFTMVFDLSRYLKLEYRNTDNILFTGGWIDYTIPFRFICYLDTQVGRPEYKFEEEAEDRDGYTFVEKQVSEKVFKFHFFAPEYLCDALRLVRLNDYIRVTTKDDVYDIEKFLITPEWTDDGYLASVEVEFECDTVVKKIAKGSYYTNEGSFSNDNYNQSFD